MELVKGGHDDVYKNPRARYESVALVGEKYKVAFRAARWTGKGCNNNPL